MHYYWVQENNRCVGINWKKKKCILVRSYKKVVKKKGSTAGKCV